ncbi:PEP-CTERM sorting domain-containing protein [Nostoc sp. FACHB-280]|uniref:PEP-CTERM sorting domain-containing protein n=1 Tax=Nostoc sp. FACHB-280 TaxID=2692839 RepID=UPI00168B646B|nr:PEP-CTERM sorting domain-containing protein [Nostoc sp. FACHB-280]MBD2493414.1 PEP-CTERM sorting domain-containing protein [Nostoc sp. FACHB-280]
MSKKSLALVMALIAVMCNGFISKVEAFSITPDENEPTFILNEEKYALRAIKGLKILNKKYDIKFVNTSLEIYSPYSSGILIFSQDYDNAQNASLTLWQALINFYDSSNHAFLSIEDTNGNLRGTWNIPVSSLSERFWWEGLVYGDSIGLARKGPFGSSTYLLSTRTYVHFTQSTGSSVPEPLTIFGSLTAAGFGIAMKRKFVSPR